MTVCLHAHTHTRTRARTLTGFSVLRVDDDTEWVRLGTTAEAFDWRGLAVGELPEWEGDFYTELSDLVDFYYSYDVGDGGDGDVDYGDDTHTHTHARTHDERTHATHTCVRAQRARACWTPWLSSTA